MVPRTIQFYAMLLRIRLYGPICFTELNSRYKFFDTSYRKALKAENIVTVQVKTEDGYGPFPNDGAMEEDMYFSITEHGKEILQKAFFNGWFAWTGWLIALIQFLVSVFK